MRFAKAWRVALGAGLLAGILASAPAALGAEQARAERFAPKARLRPGDPKVDLNHASVEDLMRLPGIGRKRAEAILALRKKRPFRRVMELRRVRGLGRKSMQRLLPLVTVGIPKGQGPKK